MSYTIDGVNHNPISLITALSRLVDSHVFCAVGHEPAVTLTSTVFSVRYEMWVKGELNMEHVVQYNTNRGQHSYDGINAWFSRRLKKRRMKESVDYRVKVIGACHMTSL